MMKFLFFFGLFFLALSGIPAVSASMASVWGPRAAFKTTIVVADETGQPVRDAKVEFAWGRLNFSPPDTDQVVRTTDENGRTSVEAKSVFNNANVYVSKPGYYTTRSAGFDAPLFRERVNDRWEPWNLTLRFVLKRIRNPVAMYVRRLTAFPPAANAPCGFDFERGDWLPPFGHGQTTDVVVRANSTNPRIDGFELIVQCPRAGDGLQRFTPDPAVGGSELRSPHEAPATGYLKEIKLVGPRHPDAAKETPIDPNAGYFLRLRSVVGADGNVVKAWYGKIYGEFFEFTCYLNPDETRNLEFDPTRNLLKPPGPYRTDYENLKP